MSAPSSAGPQGPTTGTGFTITTPRLTIRTAQPGDAGPLLAYLTHPDNYGAIPDLTKDDLLARIGKWAAKTAEGESAFMIILPRGGEEEQQQQQEQHEVIGFGGFNSLPRTANLNSSEKLSDGVEEDVKVKAGDMGISFAAAWQRKVSAFCAVYVRDVQTEVRSLRKINYQGVRARGCLRHDGVWF